MAVALRGLCRLAIRSRCQYAIRTQAIGRRRAFTTTTSLLRSQGNSKLTPEQQRELDVVDDTIKEMGANIWDDEDEEDELDDEDLELLKKLQAEEDGEELDDDDGRNDERDEDDDGEDDDDDGFDVGDYDEDDYHTEEDMLWDIETARETQHEDIARKSIAGEYGLNPPDLRSPKPQETFLNLGEEDRWEEPGMVPDDEDDITAQGHVELEQHREMRHYARLAAWEMPLLYNLRTTFVPPTAAKPLRFRYTSYMGEQHPAEKKVSVEFCPQDLPDLSDIQREKLLKLVGTRYNSQKGIVKMSCDIFESQAQNKRYLGDKIEELLTESKTGDMFEDVPLRVRKYKERPMFPQEWHATEKRLKELEATRQRSALKDQQLELEGQVIDGIQQIEIGMVKRAPIAALPELASAGQGKGKRVGIRR